MKVRNVQADAIPSTLTKEELGRAMSQLDLDAIPPHKRPQAVMDHLMAVMSDTIQDQQTASEIRLARLLHNKT
jgi:hypothetical protein